MFEANNLSFRLCSVASMRTEVIRSRRRKKTVEAKVVDGVVRVLIPASMSAAEEAHWVELMRGRIERELSSSHIDLRQRALELAREYALPLPDEVVFSHRQRLRWGSCTPETGRVRISSRVAEFPPWVVDYVIVHELAHLIHSNHSADFWGVVHRYPLAERARGYLLAKAEIAPP
jgi:predicted metal-dependent hydrolase